MKYLLNNIYSNTHIEKNLSLSKGLYPEHLMIMGFSHKIFCCFSQLSVPFVSTSIWFVFYNFYLLVDILYLLNHCSHTFL